jgi:lipopolysaccharide export system protein LptA
MKRQEAARYARWSASAAIAIVVLVAGVYLHRRFGARVARHELPPPVPAAVQQQSAQFTYSKMIGPRPLFTVHASRATEYKDQNRSLLEDVVITIYGTAGNRHDTVSARECSYLPKSEQIRCKGTVQIDLRDASPSGKVSSPEMHLETRDISFNRDGQEVSTPNGVSFEFPGGKGQGTGLMYDTRAEAVKLLGNVKLQIDGKKAGDSQPIDVTGGSLEYDRKSSLVRLSGAVRGRQGQRTFESGNFVVALASDMHPRSAVADQGVRFTDAALRGKPSLSAKRMQVAFGPSGEIKHVFADGNVHAEQTIPSGAQDFSAQHVELSLDSQNGAAMPRELLATGNVRAESQRPGVSRRLTTEALRLQFQPVSGRRGFRLASAQTTTPGDILTTQPGETDRIQAGNFAAQFDLQNRLTKLSGGSGVKVTRQIGASVTQETSARNLAATFAATREWETIEESGGVKFRQGDRVAQADRMTVARVSSEMALDGSAFVSNATSSTSADHIEINQTTGVIRARGSAVSTYWGTATGQPSNLGREAAHVSADQVEASSADGHAIYSGHARMWEGDLVVDADAIELWQHQNKIEARGGVRGIFPAFSGKGQALGTQTSKKNHVPILWQIRAPLLDYWGDAGRAELSGGVQARSVEGALSCHSLELLMASGGDKRQLKQATALGNVHIVQNGRVATAERALYTADDGKIVLSGGPPALLDASGNTTTGRELTFFLASDTILVDSQKGSRTITKHRVEK